MKITFVGRQMTVPQDLKDLVEKKLSKLDKYFYDEADTTVTFSRRKNKERLEITINVSSTLFRSEAEEAAFRDALDRAGVTDCSAAVMVGDRHHDIDGAKAVGISSVGVLYGYGDREEHEAAGANAIVESVDKLRTALLS